MKKAIKRAIYTVLGVLSGILTISLSCWGALGFPTYSDLVVTYDNYNNSDHGISLEYPSHWHIYEDNEVINQTYGDDDPIPPRFQAAFYLMGNSGNITSLNIVIVSSYFSFPAFTEWRLEQAEKQGFNTLDSGQTTLAGNTAHSITYTRADGAKYMDIWIVDGVTAYILQYGSESESDYEFFLDSAQRMIDSFEITPS